MGHQIFIFSGASRKATSGVRFRSPFSAQMFIFASTTFFASILLAKTYAIHITGIDIGNRNQNTLDYYQEAAEFSRFCQARSQDYVCEKYVNENLNLAADTRSPSQKTPDHRGTATKAKVLASLKDALQKAGSGDKVIISLDNHGRAPSGNGASCISLGNGESICDEDLKPLLVKINQEAKVAVIAQGCFSGGFAKLANRNTCVVTTSDQNLVSYTNSIWNFIRSGQIKRVSDVSQIRNTSWGTYSPLRTASDAMFMDSCHRVFARAEKIRGLSSRAISLSAAVASGRTACANSSELQAIARFSELIGVIHGIELEDSICESEKETTRGALICENWKAMNALRMDSIYKRTHEEHRKNYEALLAELTFNEKDFKSSGEHFDFSVATLARLDTLLQGQEPRPDSLGDTEKDPDERAKKIYQAYLDFLGTGSAVQKIRLEINKKRPSLSEFSDKCLFQGYPAPFYPGLVEFSRSYELNQPRNLYTDQQRQDAKACEEDFYF